VDVHVFELSVHMYMYFAKFFVYSPSRIFIAEELLASVF
jgi:hypothetical protein